MPARSNEFWIRWLEKQVRTASQVRLIRKVRPTRPTKPLKVMRLERVHLTEPQVIRCKWCGSEDTMKYGIRYGVQEYICSKCKRRFTNKDSPYKMRYTTEQIGSALTAYYDGLSLADIARHLGNSGSFVNPSSVYRWLLRYTKEAIHELGSLRANTSDTWVVDETVIWVNGKKVWFWDIIDRDTRFLLASHISKSRTIHDVRVVMTRAAQRASKIPRYILSDGMPAYPDGIERVFGADAKHIKSMGFTEELNTNLIERFHGSIKERYKVMRGFKTLETAKLILDGFLVHYNFFRPHMTLNGKTPAEVAGIDARFKSWIDIVKGDKSL